MNYLIDTKMLVIGRITKECIIAFNAIPFSFKIQNSTFKIIYLGVYNL
jgi:hypothetical protein